MPSLYGFVGANQSFEVHVQKTTTTRQIRLLASKDNGGTTTSSWYDLTTGWHAVEVQLQTAGAVNANDGTASLYLDGVLKQTLTGIDNDTRTIDSIRLGVSGIDSGMRGSLTLTDFDPAAGVMESRPGVFDSPPGFFDSLRGIFDS